MSSAPTGTTNGGNIDREYRQKLGEILSQDVDEATRRIRDILQLGADWFDVELGLLVEVDQSGKTYTIDEVSTSHPDITRGLTGDLLSTYCRMVVTEQEPLVLESAPEQGWSDDLAYQNSLLATYIGAEVVADREIYGTVCFVDLEPRDAPFGDEDRTFLELVANGVGRVLEQQVAADAELQDTPQDLSMVERRYRTALKHSPVLFAKVDADLRYEWLYNPHPDFDPETAVGKRDDDLDSGPGIDQLMDLKRRTLERGEQIREEITFERSDGLNVYDVTATPLREGPGDEVTGLITASLNITEQKETERKYRESEARYRALAENFPNGAVGVYDRDLRYTLVEGALVGEVLPDTNEFTGSRMPDIFPAETVCDIEPLFRAAVEEGYAIYTDITARERRERILRERQEKVEALYRATDRLLRAEHEEEIATSILNLVNEVFGYLVGVRLVRDGQLVPIQLSPELPDHVPPRPSFDVEGESVVATAFREGETVAFDDLRTADDPFDYGEVRASAIIPIGEHGTVSVGDVEVGGIDDFDRRLIEVLATYASTSLDRLDREKALIEAKEKAEEAARLKASMMANMSHEIRTPLTSVIGFAEILAERLEGELGTFAQRAHRSSNRLMRMLESVLDLSRLEAGTFDLERAQVQVSSVVQHSVERFRPEAKRENLSLTTDLPDRQVTGLLNEEAIRRILENLLENAIKFTPDGGAVMVRIRTEENIVLEVEDTGVGVSEEALPKIFKAFKQESEGLDREYEGSGLGLSIVQELTEALGGTLEVETEKGEGSRFIVRLPRSDEDSSAED